MLIPFCDATRESVSTNIRLSAAASSFPTEDLPVQRYPIKNRLSVFTGSPFRPRPGGAYNLERVTFSGVQESKVQGSTLFLFSCNLVVFVVNNT
jgi:hypothetical protein